MIQRALEGKKFTDNEIRQIMSSILQAVNYIHEKEIVHRDIKPGF